MSGPTDYESVSLDGLDFTELVELYICTRDAKTDDVGAMANIFIKSFKDDDTAQLLYSRDEIWPEVVEMLRSYLADDYTHVILAEDETTDTIIGWTSVSLMVPDEEDYFMCESYFPTRVSPFHHVWGAGDFFRLLRHVF